MKKSWIARFLTGVCFLTVAFASCKPKAAEEVVVYMPDGAPALAMASLMAEDSEGDGADYRVVAASTIASKVTNKEEAENADLCVLPLTAASKLLGNGERYQMLGTLTHGNLYLIAKEGFAFDGLSSLIDKRVGVLQMNEVPGLTFKATLQKAEVAYSEVTNEGEGKEDTVRLLPITGPDAVGVVEADCFLLAEPAATLQKRKGYSIVGDVQALYGGEKGYPQAVLVGKNTLLEERADWVDGFLSKVEKGGEWLLSASGEEIVETVRAHLEDKTSQTSLKADSLTVDVLGRCGIYFTHAQGSEGEVEGFLKDLIAVNNKAAAIPAQEFYWLGKIAAKRR